MSRGLGLLLTLLVTYWIAIPDPVAPDPATPRPIPAKDTVFTEDLTWMEIRDAMKSGKDTIIIATGGVEQNGPYLVTGKHNVVLRGTTEAIARKVNALVAPIIPFVPEGDIDPPTAHMKYPGSISVTEDTFQRLLIDVCSSFATHGFRNIILIGDSGGNQAGMKAVAEQLNAKWEGRSSRIYYLPEYYNYDKVGEWVVQQGIKETPEGLHDDFGMTAVMMAVDPESVRTRQRIEANRFKINGVSLAPAEKTIAYGKQIIEFRAEATAKAFKAAQAR